MVKHLILFILIFSFMACDKDDGNLIPDIYTGTASVTINGEEWNSLTYFDEINSSKNPSLFILRMDRYNNAGIQIESFNIRRIQASFEVQEITSTDNQNELGLLSAGYLTIYGGDVLGDIYDLDTTAINNFIQITSYNSSRAEIKGIFNVSLILTRDSNEPGTPPQNLVFTNGEFTVKVQREWFE